MNAGYLFLVLFAATLFVLYIAVRRAWGNTLYNGLVGAVLSAIFVMLFSLTAEKTSTAQAIFAGIIVGLGFAAIVVVIAVFFRANQPGADVTLVSRSQQEDSGSGQRHNTDQTPE
jgi:ABC-type Fe3+-siderophore transport system permease subunit